MTDQTPDPEMAPEELERLRARLTAPAAPDGALDRARVAALEAFDEVHADGDGAAPVRDITSARTSRAQAWYQRIPLGAAAAVVAVVALVGAFSQLDLSSSDGEDSATADFDATSGALDDDGDSGGDSLELDTTERSAEDEAFSAPDAGDGSADDGESAPTTSAEFAVPAYDDVDALVEDYRRRFDPSGRSAEEDDDAATPPQTTASSSQSYGCDAVDAAGIDGDRVVALDPVRLGSPGDRTDAVAVVYESEASGLRVAVVVLASCDVLRDRAL